jgi:hypothetical protein
MVYGVSCCGVMFAYLHSKYFQTRGDLFYGKQHAQS